MFVKPSLIDAKKHAALFAELVDADRGKSRLKVFDPQRRDLLPEEGREVPEHPYWHRRLRDADVELCSDGEIAALRQAATPTAS
jgi:hypothetical protein